MSKDRTAVWVMEYLCGFLLLTTVVPAVLYARPDWSDAHVLAVELFAIGLGVSLVSCASAMRQRIIMTRRIDQLVEQIKASQHERTSAQLG